jgi:lipopolysaccharide export system permease protein
MRMARADEWTVWFGKFLGTAVLSPIACFFTYKANNDSVVFNIDLYKDLLMRTLGLRTKRHLMKKEVIIDDPQYDVDAERLQTITADINRYTTKHNLLRWPSPIKVFFRPGDDHDIERINALLEETIEDLSYTKDNYIILKLNQYPIIAANAHTRPFRRKWLNVMTGVFLPTGIFFYFRMLRYRFRLYKDLQSVVQTNKKLLRKVAEKMK